MTISFPRGSGGSAVTIACPDCSLVLVTVEASPLFYGDSEGHRWRGQHVELALGFVAKRLHASGVPWYVPGRNPVSQSPKVRANRPFVITCRCNRDVPVDLVRDVLKSS